MAVRLSALRTGRAVLPRKNFYYSFLLEAESTKDHSAAGTIKKNWKNYHIGNQTRDLQACIIVSQPSMLPRAPLCGKQIPLQSVYKTNAVPWSSKLGSIISQRPKPSWRICLTSIKNGWFSYGRFKQTCLVLLLYYRSGSRPQFTDDQMKMNPISI
jgi:hypothetical protein